MGLATCHHRQFANATVRCLAQRNRAPVLSVRRGGARL